MTALGASHWDGGETLADRFRAHARNSQHLYGYAMRGLADDWEAGGPTRLVCRGYEDAPRGAVGPASTAGCCTRILCSGAEHYLIRYPPGLQAQRHTHRASHTIIVLAGRLSANQQVLGSLSYCHFPAGAVMHHAPAGDQGCLFVTIFDGPFDVTPVPGH